MQVTTVGLDLAKRVFQVHGVDAGGRVVMRRKLQRGEVAAFFADLPSCLVGMEACATAHHWARLIGASGHEVRLIPPSYVKPYVRRSKTDAADAQAICEAVGRPSMRFVPVKSAAQQAALLHHRLRDLLVRQRTMLINALRGHLGEFGIIAPAGRHRVVDLINLLQDAGDADVPALAREALRGLIAELHALEERIEAVEAVICARAQDERRQPAIGEHSGHWTNHCVGDRRHHCGSLGVQVRPRVGRVDRARATPALERWQTEARPRVQTRGPLFETFAHHRRDSGDAPTAG
jgi:transposase